MKVLLVAFFTALLTMAQAYAESDTQETAQELPQVFVNLNSDDAERIATLMKGVGPSIAERIVAYRTEHGDFSSLDDLLQVKGIGPKTLEKNRHLLKL